jgi:hypothetical protein
MEKVCVSEIFVSVSSPHGVLTKSVEILLFMETSYFSSYLVK